VHYRILRIDRIIRIGDLGAVPGALRRERLTAMALMSVCGSGRVNCCGGVDGVSAWAAADHSRQAR
jgi:hypothetical protein